MALVGFNFTSMGGEVKGQPKGKYSITPTMGLKDVKVQDFHLAKDDSKKVLNIKFQVGFKYNPDIATIAMTGEMLYLIPAEMAPSVESTFKEKKSLPETITKHVMKTIFNKGQTQAIVIARDLNLPSPVPLPKLSIEKKEAVSDAAQNKKE